MFAILYGTAPKSPWDLLMLHTPSPPWKCQSGTLVCASRWAQQVAVNRYVETPDWQTKQMTLTQPLESSCLLTVSTQTRRQDFLDNWFHVCIVISKNVCNQISNLKKTWAAGAHECILQYLATGLCRWQPITSSPHTYHLQCIASMAAACLE